MFNINIDQIIENFSSSIIHNTEIYLPKIVWAIILLLIWIIIAIGIYKFIMYLFKKFNIIELIDKLNIEFEKDIEWDNKTIENNEWIKNNKKIVKKLSDKIKINEIVSKAISYYIFLVFFRLSIVVIWIKEVEDFLKDLLTYLPSLFIAVVIWFFGVRFANFIYDVVFHALDLTKQKTAKIIASWAKVIVLFFTLMVVLSKIWIATEITNTILIWFISMLALAWWLAFWLGWKDIAHEILESFRK
jgi:hypothetical protein